MSLVIASVVFGLSIFIAPSQATPPSPREHPDTAIAEAIRLLEAKDYKTFVSQFVPPDQLKARAGSPEAFNTFVERFAERADRLLAAFKYIRTQKPTYDQAKTTATFQLDGQADAPSTSLTFVKIGQYWYLANR